MREIAKSFGTVRVNGTHRAELIVNHGELLGAEAVVEFHDCLKAQFDEPFSLLINKQFEYGLTFEAMERIGNIAGCHSIAILAPRREALITAEVEKSIHMVMAEGSAHAERIRIFSGRTEAENWLQAREEALPTPGELARQGR